MRDQPLGKPAENACARFCYAARCESCDVDHLEECAVDQDDLWNLCVDGDCDGVGGRHMFVLIAVDGMISNGGVLNEVESLLQDADPDDDYSYDDVISACAWATAQGDFPDARKLQIAFEAARIELAKAETLPTVEADELVEQAELTVDAIYLRDYNDRWIEQLLAAAYARSPQEFVR